MLVAAAPSAHAQTAPAVNDPPPPGRSVTAFPARDFVSADGFLQGHTYRVDVVHPLELGGRAVSSQGGIVPQDDPATPEFEGLVEVNHPGGACWDGTTPNILPGDLVRVVNEQTGDIDQTTVSNVTARRPVQTGPGTVQIHGTAQDANGLPLPLDQLEQRLVAPGDQFDKSRRRDLRATGAPGANGRLAYDSQGSIAWTATYTDLTPADVERALSAESMARWLGRDPAAGTEGTIFEIGAGITAGPQAPCTAPLERILIPGVETEPPTTPTGVTAVVSDNNTVTLTWAESTDNVGVTSYGVYRNGRPLFNVQNADASAPAPTSFKDLNVPPGTYTYSVDATDDAGNRSALASSEAVTTVANPAPAIPVSEPPLGGKAIVAFPSRDFAEVEGFALDEQATIQVVRNGNIISSADGLIPSPDGVIEVNHPGGGCWAGATPEIRAGDVVRALTYGPDGALRAADQLTVANVTATRAVQTAPDTVQIHGTAIGHDGKPLPLGEIEQRLVASSKEPFALNGRRTLRAPGDGTIAYDAQDNPMGTKWTATYTGLSAADVALALSVESRILWLGRDPLAGVELTIFENGSADPPGPAPAYCESPLEPIDKAGPSAPVLTVTQPTADDVQLNWTEATDNHYVYGYRVLKDGQPLANVGRDVRSFTDAGVSPGTHRYAVLAYDSASPWVLSAGNSSGSVQAPRAGEIEQLTAGQGKPYGNLGEPSLEQSVTVLDVTGPSEPSNLQAKVNVPNTGAPTVGLSWDAATDDVGVTGYLVFRRPVATPAATFTEIDRVAGAVTSYTDTTVALSGQYEYTIAAVDAAGNQSTQAPRVAVTVTFDEVAPSTPDGVRALNWPDVHAKDVRLTWNAATDNVGVSRYGIYRDGTLLKEVSAATALAYDDVNRPAGTYQYAVDAVDSAGNRSARSVIDTVTVANDPPTAGHAVEVFPQRDMVSATGYPAGSYRFQVLRGRRVVSESNAISPVGGTIEVNHGGSPGCWNATTPDIRPGDVVRIIGADGVAEQTTTANVISGRPIQTAADTVVVHGTAADAQGNPLPLGQLEQRLVSVGANFAKNGRNSLLTPADGTLAYDGPGATRWTARYTGLTAADVTRALNADSAMSWLGRDPLAGNELTISENGADVAGGPATPDCTAPLDAAAPRASSTPANVGFGPVAINTTATRTVTLSNSGTTPLTVRDAYIAGANFPAAFSITSNSCPATLAPGASCSVTVAFSPGTSLQARTASLNFTTDAGNATSHSVRLTGTGFDASAPTVSAPAHALTQGDPIKVAAAVADSTVPVKVSWSSATATQYELQVTRNGGTTWTPVALSAPAATSASHNLALTAGAVQYRVRAGRDLPDGSVAWSAWIAGQRFTLTPADSAQTAQITYSGAWSNLTVAGALGGSVRQASASADSARTAKLAYSANSIVGVIASKGPNLGRMTFQLDGGALTTVDLYSPTAQKATLVFVRSGIAAGDHQVTIRPAGSRNASSTSNRIELDGIVSLR